MTKVHRTLNPRLARDEVTQVTRYTLPSAADPIWRKGQEIVKLLSDYLDSEETRA